MNLLARLIIFALILTDAVLVVKILTAGKIVAILQPAGLIALQERNLMLAAVSLMLLVVVPVFILAFHVATKYHAGNTNARYEPEWDHSTKLQIFLWGFPTLIICILSSMVWIYAHKLDPHIALSSTTKPVTIQVVALRWKWLFIYPEQRIATVNSVVFPEKTPLNFELTASDTPMNSFWIPQLGGQIYAMSGMATQTHMMANRTGEYRGSNAEISGEGFAGMRFTAKSVSRSDFDSWVASVKQSPQTLTLDTFNTLAKPSEDNQVTYFSSTPDNLYITIVMKYMAKPSPEQKNMSAMNGMEIHGR